MNWTTELIKTFQNEKILRRDSRISQILGEEPLFPPRLPFFQKEENIRNSNIIVELTEEEILEYLSLRDIPNTIFKYFDQIPYLFQTQLFDSLFKDRFSIIRKGRQIGLTNILINFLLYQVLMNNDSHNIIMGIKNQDLHHIQQIFLAKLERIPIGFQSGMTRIQDFRLNWENGSSITLTSKIEHVISQNYDNIILLDASHFNDLSMILNMIVPTVSARTQGRIILEGNISTKKSFFNDLCSGNKFPFHEKIVDSLSVPNRDDLWERQMIQRIGLENYLTEFLCLIPGTTEYNREVNLNKLLNN